MKFKEFSVDYDNVAAFFACKGYLNLLKWGISTKMVDISCHSYVIIRDAAEGGHLDIIKWLKDDMKIRIGQEISYAAKYGHINILQWGLEHASHAGVCVLAAEGGHLDVIKWARENGQPWASNSIIAAAHRNNEEIVKYLIENGCEMDTDEITEAIASKGNLSLLLWVIEHGCRLSRSILSYAASYNHKHVIEYFINNKKLELTNRVFSSAAEGGYLDLLKWLHTKNCPNDQYAYTRPVIDGFVEVVQFLRDINCPLTEDQRNWLKSKTRNSKIIEILDK